MKRIMQLIRTIFLDLPLFFLYAIAMYIGEKRGKFYLILLTISLSSCGAASFVGNPKPNLKRVHFMIEHWSYTEAEYNSHPDYDCTIDKKEMLKN